MDGLKYMCNVANMCWITPEQKHIGVYIAGVQSSHSAICHKGRYSVTSGWHSSSYTVLSGPLYTRLYNLAQK